MPDVTVVVGIDQNTVQQLAVSIPTWKRYRKEMFSWPWVLFYDRMTPLGIRRDDAERVASEIIKAPCTVVEWPPYPGHEPFRSQRGKMVAGFVHVPPEHVETPYWMKIDTDVVALTPTDDWYDPSWFSGKYCYVAPSWGYTKAKPKQTENIQEWADSLERWGDYSWPSRPRLDLKGKIRGDKIKMSRMCSWVSYYRTDWSRAVSESVRKYRNGHVLPVPSQDTVHWYAAARRADTVMNASMKRRGWTNCPRFVQLQHTVEAALATHV